MALVFDPLKWAAALSVAAAVVLLAEAVAALSPLHRGRRAAFWGVLGGSLAAGAVLGWIWAAWAGELTPLIKPLLGALPAASRAALIAALGLLPACVLLAGAGIVQRLGGAAGEPAGGRAMLGAAKLGAIPALAAATAFWTPQGAVLTIGLTAVRWAARSYRRTTSPIAKGVRRGLLGLRIVVVLLLTAWAIRPALEYRRQEEVRNVLLICGDISSSMRRRDAEAGPSTRLLGSEPISRIEAVRRALAARRADLADLSGKAQVELTGFSASPQAAETFAPDSGWDLTSLAVADGQATAIGDSLAEAFEQYAAQQRKLAAVVVVSDGCNNTSDRATPARAATLLGSRGVPVHAVAVGSDRVTSATRMLTVRELSAPDEVEAFNRLPATAAIETIGLAGRQIKVTCRFGAEEVGSEVLTADQPQATLSARFVHVPLQAGFHRLSVTAEVAGSPVADLTGRPEAAKLIHVTDRELRVLYVEGKFRYEAKYLTQALVAARRFTVDRRVLLQPLAEKAPPPLSENLDDWLAYHAVIFGDVAAAQFTDRQLQIVRDLVGKYGKGFCMIGGGKSFGAGGWAGTPIADVLPIDLGASAQQIDAAVKVVPSRDGQSSDIMRIGDGEVAADWGKLDPLTGANKLTGLKPAAVVLAETPARDPLIVAQTYGKGRSMAIAFDTTWRWVLTKKDTADMQRRFWRQVALFLAAPKGAVWIVTDKTTYDLRRLLKGSEVIRVRAGVEDAQGRPLMDAPVQAKLITPDNKESPLALQKSERMREGQLPPPSRKGVYTLRIQAQVGDKQLAAEHRFEVAQADLESLDVLANHDLMRQVAAAGGGEFVTLDKLGELLAELRISTRPEKRDAVTHVSLSRDLRWPVIVALIILLCAEWAVRKRRGLV